MINYSTSTGKQHMKSSLRILLVHSFIHLCMYNRTCQHITHTLPQPTSTNLIKPHLTEEKSTSKPEGPKQIPNTNEEFPTKNNEKIPLHTER